MIEIGIGINPGELFSYDREFWAGPPRFIAIEGNDGAGKTTLTSNLVRWMQQSLELKVAQFREPGSGQLAAHLRDLLLTSGLELTTYEEIMLMTTARLNTRLSLVQPALAEGKWVICDRAELSSIIYQGYARDEGAMKLVKELQDQIRIAVRRADLYVVLHVDFDEAQRRLGRTGKEPDRFEGSDERFRRRVQKGFDLIEQMVPGEYRMAHVDAGVDEMTLLARTVEAIEDNLG